MTGLWRGHNQRLARIDPRVAPAAPLPDQDVAYGRAAGCVSHQRFAEDSYAALWGALCRHTLRIQVEGSNPAPAFDAVLTGLMAQLRVEPDCAAVLTWPSFDTACAAPLVRGGFVPLATLAVKQLDDEPGLPQPGIAVRAAESGDLDWLTTRALRLHRFEAELGALPDRPGAGDLLREEFADALTGNDQVVLIARVDGRRVGFVHGQPPIGAWIERQVTVRPAAYLSRLFVEPAARKKSVGRALVVAAQDMFRAKGAAFVLLHHTPHNPYAYPMWARFGYFPVLTTWSQVLG